MKKKREKQTVDSGGKEYAKAQTIASQRVLRTGMVSVRNPFISVTGFKPFEVNPAKFIRGIFLRELQESEPD